MSVMDKIRNPQGGAALLAALGLLLGGSLGGVARAQTPAKAMSQVEAQEQAAYTSSIQVPNDHKWRREGKEAHKTHRQIGAHHRRSGAQRGTRQGARHGEERRAREW
jgi:hypothetical protein